MTEDQSRSEDKYPEGPGVQMVAVPDRLAPAILELAKSMQFEENEEPAKMLPVSGSHCHYTHAHPPYDASCSDVD